MQDKLKALTFLMIAIGLLYVFDGISQNALFGNRATGLVVSEHEQGLSQQVAQQDVGCYDTDNRDHYVTGTTYAKLFKVNGEAPKQDVCEGNTLIEYYCVFSEPQVEFYECPNGCFGGSCAR